MAENYYNAPPPSTAANTASKAMSWGSVGAVLGFAAVVVIGAFLGGGAVDLIAGGAGDASLASRAYTFFSSTATIAGGIAGAVVFGVPAALMGGALFGAQGAAQGISEGRDAQGVYMARAQQQAIQAGREDMVRAEMQTRQMEAEASLHQSVALREMLQAQQEGKLPPTEQLAAMAAGGQPAMLQAEVPGTKIDAASIADMQALAEAPGREAQV